MSVINTGWLFPAVRQCEAEQEQVGEFLHWRQSQMCKNCTFIFVVNIQLHSTDRHFQQVHTCTAESPFTTGKHPSTTSFFWQVLQSADDVCFRWWIIEKTSWRDIQFPVIDWWYFPIWELGKTPLSWIGQKQKKKPLKTYYSRVPTNSTYSAYYLIID